MPVNIKKVSSVAACIAIALITLVCLVIHGQHSTTLQAVRDTGGRTVDTEIYHDSPLYSRLMHFISPDRNTTEIVVGPDLSDRDAFHLYRDISRLSNVVHYHAGRQMCDEYICFILDMPQLETLNLDDSDVTSTSIERLISLEKLWMLSISRIAVDQNSIDACSRLTQIQQLYLSGNDFEGLDMSPISRMTELRLLDLSHSNVSLDQVASISAQSTIETIDIRGVGFEDAEIEYIKSLNNHIKYIYDRNRDDVKPREGAAAEKH